MTKMHNLRFFWKNYHGRKTYQSISSVIFVSALPLCDWRKNSKKWVTIVSKRENRVHLFMLGRVWVEYFVLVSYKVRIFHTSSRFRFYHFYILKLQVDFITQKKITVLKDEIYGSSDLKWNTYLMSHKNREGVFE